MAKLLPNHFQRWELLEYPSFPGSNVHSWVGKTSSNGEVPLYVILALQTNRKININSNISQLDRDSHLFTDRFRNRWRLS